MIDYRLHVFRQVAEVRSLTKASKALHLSQPAVSKHIKLLEEELRVPLFVRSSTGVVLTDAGTIFLRHVHETEKSRAAVMGRTLDRNSSSWQQHDNRFVLPPGRARPVQGQARRGKM